VTVAPSRAASANARHGSRFPTKGIVVTARQERSRISVIAERQGIGEHTRTTASVAQVATEWVRTSDPTYLVNAFTSSGFVKGSTPEISPK